MKIKRDAFVYMAPLKGAIGIARDLFAQCAPCRMFVPKTALPPRAKVKPDCNLCIVHGSQDAIDGPIGSCGVFAPWPTPDGSPNPKVVRDHAGELAKGIRGSFTKITSGYVERKVRCENCEFARDEATHCHLYAMLNEKFPERFDLDTKIEPKACCNANEPKIARRAEGGRVGYAEGGAPNEDVTWDASPTHEDITWAPANQPVSTQTKTIGDRLKYAWENATPGGPLWMAKELYEGVKGSVDAAHALTDVPHTEEDFENRRIAAEQTGPQTMRAAQFLSPSAPAGGLFGAAIRGPVVPSVLAAPEAEARRAVAREFGVDLTRGQATQDLDRIRYEDMAARGAYGKEAQDRAAGVFDQQFNQVQQAGREVGSQFAHGEQPLASPADAAQSVNTEIGANAAAAREVRDAAGASAEQEAARARQATATSQRALDETIGGEGALATPRDAGEITNQALRDAAARDRAHYQASYENLAREPGTFQRGTFEGVGSRIQNALHFNPDSPVEINELTPAANHAINALNEWSTPTIRNAADPRSRFADPQTEVSLNNVHTFMKRLSQFYSQAKDPTDRRAVGRIMGEFGDQVEQAVSNGLFSGDPRALQMLSDAKASFRQYQLTYKPREAGDDVGTAMRRIVQRDATPEETANMIIGSGKLGNAGLPVRIADRLQETLGTDSEAWTSIRQAIWQKASQVRNASGEVDPIKSAQSILGFVDSSLSRRMFSPQERSAMRTHAQGVRDLDRVIENLPATRAAETAQTAYEQAFGGAELSGAQRQAFRRMVDGTATPEETVNAVFSAIAGGNSGNTVRMLSAVERIVGADSQIMGAIKQGVWQKLTQNPAGKDPQGQQKLVQGINEFLNGKGRTIARQLYTPEQRALMGRYAEAVRLTIIPKYARTNSDTAPALLAAARKYGAAVTTSLGYLFHGGLSGGAEGYAVKRAIEYGAEKVGKYRQAKKLNESLDDVIPVTKPARPLPAARQASRLLLPSVRGATDRLSGQ